MNILVIDAGSSSVRALLFDETLHVLASVSRPYQFVTQPPGAGMVDAHFLRDLVEACLDEILQHPAAGEIGAAGMSVFVSNLLGLDAAGQPVTPIFAYADARSAADVDMLREKIDAAATHQRTGTRLHPSYHPPKLHWLQRTRQSQGVAQWADFATYIYRCWFGRDVPCSFAIASWTGMLNRAGLTWDETWLKLLNLTPGDFPPLADYTAAQTGLSDAYASRWSVLRDVPFFLAVGDGAVANVGSGAVKVGQIALTMGTTSAMRTVTDEAMPVVPDGLWSYRVDARHHLIGGAMAEGGNIYQWMTQTLKLPSDAESELLKREPDAHGLTLLPLLAGERAPGWQADATGTIAGVRISTTPLDMLQAGLEGVAIRLALIKQRLMPDGGTVFAGGGAIATSRVWAQICADTLDCPLHLIAETEVSARGMAILVLCALHQTGLDAYPPALAAVIEPRPAYVPRMRAALERQQALYERMVRQAGA